MACVLLDIGAGSKEFIRRLKWRNFGTPILAFAGEPAWHFFEFFVNEEAARALIECGQVGSYRIRSSYRSFAFDDASLDVVTCNAPLPPFWLPYGMEAELARCLKPGGIFFYSFPSPSFYLKLDLDALGFERLGNGAFTDKGNAVRVKRMTRKGMPRVFPPSSVIRWNLYEKRLRSMGPNEGMRSSSYVYFNSGVCPSWELWQKPL